MQLRTYQTAAIEALRGALNDEVKNPLVCMSTASGKTATMCSFVSDLSGRYPDEKFAILVHSEELIAQIAETYERISGTKPAVYAASLKRKEMGRVTIAQIQSVHTKALKFGAFKLVIIDECDCVTTTGDGMYRTFLKEARVANPSLRVCGFTATPFRTATGLVYGPDQPFETMVYDTSIIDLMQQGWLCPLTSKDGGAPDLTGVAVRQGEFVSAQLEAVMSDDLLVEKACDEMLVYGAARKSWLVFTSGIKHAALVADALLRKGVVSATITGETNKEERRALIADFREGRLRALLNIQCLTVGFDAPGTDMVVMLRPTQSPRLYVQMVGRGLRISPAKRDTLILDLAGNISRHGPIDTLNERIKSRTKKEGKGEAPTKTCENCKEIVPAGMRKCPACGTEFPALAIAKHAPTASLESAVSSSEVKTLVVTRWSIVPHVPKDPAKKPSLCVTYWNGLNRISEWLSVDADAHPFARQKALAFIRENPGQRNGEQTLTVRGGKLIGTTTDREVVLQTAIECAPWMQSCILQPSSIRYQTDPNGGKYPRVLSRHYESDSIG